MRLCLGCGGCIWKIPNRGVQPIHRCPVPPWHEVPVGVHGDPDGMMPHLLFHVDERLPLLNEQTGEGVAEVVNANPPESRFCEDLRSPPFSEVVRVHLVVCAHNVHANSLTYARSCLPCEKGVVFLG